MPLVGGPGSMDELWCISRPCYSMIWFSNTYQASFANHTQHTGPKTPACCFYASVFWQYTRDRTSAPDASPTSVSCGLTRFESSLCLFGSACWRPGIELTYTRNANELAPKAKWWNAAGRGPDDSRLELAHSQLFYERTAFEKTCLSSSLLMRHVIGSHNPILNALGDISTTARHDKHRILVSVGCVQPDPRFAEPRETVAAPNNACLL
ncbi:hypothetical protein CONLIGDRAFT_402541 [Coniochaeta ligniaria NRRL 30616]|uniref:Uncharacterized protein n=1 Tax=Coniochaeta ligniaria NRRL 30616 TaxID=1408157 RepID=A0A1J7IP48_9PEZI|nr:hypothetical protein CONLIGDRAFT_402541 [Coniochaeta ligniaria NRRL 30616]